MKVTVEQNRIDRLLGKKTSGLLSVYYTAGFPTYEDTVRIGEQLSDQGADIIEIGIPFSDPVADGPVIQMSNKLALEQGMTLSLLLSQVKILRTKTEVPLILMGYLNPLLQFGLETFCREAKEAGVDGLIIPDLPLTEYQQMYQSLFESHGLYNIFLVSPTTSDERIRQIDDASHGFIYAVSSSSTTGSKNEFTEAQLSYFKRLKGLNLKHPFLIGFGIHNDKTFKAACEHSAGAIIGSAFISELSNSTDLENDIGKFVKNIKGTV